MLEGIHGTVPPDEAMCRRRGSREELRRG